MILTRVEDVHREQLALRDKIEETNKDTRKYVDARIKGLDERVKERTATEIATLREANAAQDKVLADQKKDHEALAKKIEELNKWAEGVKARWGLIGGLLSLTGGGLVAGVVALIKHLS